MTGGYNSEHGKNETDRFPIKAYADTIKRKSDERSDELA